MMMYGTRYVEQGNLILTQYEKYMKVKKFTVFTPSQVDIIPWQQSGGDILHHCKNTTYGRKLFEKGVL
jgi:hypothetical protein